MKFDTIFVFITISSVFSDDSLPGKITGISYMSAKDILHQYRTPLEKLKSRSLLALKESTERIAYTRALILKNIADSQNKTNFQLINLRKDVLQAKQEAIHSPLLVQSCIVNQDIQIAKIHVGTLGNCNTISNFTKLDNIRLKFSKLSITANGLANYCVFLNPLRNEFNNLKLCIDTKINEFNMQLELIQQEFEKAIKDVVNYSVNCILNISGVVSEKIGEVMGAVKSCRNVRISVF